MNERKFKVTKVICGNVVEGEIDLGLGVFVRARVTSPHAKAPSPRLDRSIKDKDERFEKRDLGQKSKRRLGELLKEGAKHPEGLYIKIDSYCCGRPMEISGDLKYIYARDLYNHSPGRSPWVGWQYISHQLLNEGLAFSTSL